MVFFLKYNVKNKKTHSALLLVSSPGYLLSLCVTHHCFETVDQLQQQENPVGRLWHTLSLQVHLQKVTLQWSWKSVILREVWGAEGSVKDASLKDIAVFCLFYFYYVSAVLGLHCCGGFSLVGGSEGSSSSWSTVLGCTGFGLAAPGGQL